MKLSFCARNFGEDLPNVRKALLAIKEIGYEGTELWQQLLTAVDLDALRGVVEESGLTVVQICPYFNWTGTAQQWEESMDNVRRFIDYSLELGKPFIRVFTGGVGSDDATAEQWNACVRGLREACDMAALEGISFNLETHRNKLHDSPESTLRLIADVNRPNLGVNFQPMHGFDPLDSLKRLFPHVRHVHVGNRKDGRASELADGDTPWPALVAELKTRGYGGFLSVELAVKPIIDFARRSYEFLKGLTEKH